MVIFVVVLMMAFCLVLAWWFTIAFSHLFRRADRIPLQLIPPWMRDAENQRREGWAALFIAAGLTLLALPALVQQFARAHPFQTSLMIWGPYVASVALTAAGAVIHDWPQVRRFRRWIRTKRQPS